MQINVGLIIHESLGAIHLYSDGSKRNAFNRKQSTELANDHLRLISGGKNSRVKLSLETMLQHFNTHDHVKKVKVLVAQSCLTLCDPTDGSSPGSSVHGILQARILEWVAIPSPGGLSYAGIEPRSPALQADFLPSELPQKP